MVIALFSGSDSTSEATTELTKVGSVNPAALIHKQEIK
jgi:hypothetical protein